MAAGAVNKWLGGDTAVAGNETKVDIAANWSLGTAPVAGEKIHFDGSANKTLGGTHWDALNWDVLGVLDFEEVVSSSDFSGDIGASGTYAEFNAEYNSIKGPIVIEGSGNSYLTMHTAGGDDSALLLLKSGTGNLWIKSDDGTAGTSTNDWGDVWINQGTLTIDDNAVFDTLDASGSGIVYGGDLNEDSAGNDVDVRVFGGSCYWDSQLSANTLVTAGDLYWGGTTSAGTLNGASDAGVNRVCDALEVWNTGKFHWRIQHTTHTDKSQIKQFKLFNGGTIDASNAIGAGGDKQIGSGSSEVSEMWLNTTGKFNNGAANITFGSGSSIQNWGGTLTAPNNENLSW